MNIIETRMKIESWDEKPFREFADGSKVTRAAVELGGSDDGLRSGSMDALMYYRPDGTTAFVALMRLDGDFGGRSGEVVLQGNGTFDGTIASSESVVVAGSTTGDLAGMTGTAESVSTHADYPFMPLTLRYDFE
ncbi:MAG TPA: DUF3224 domain-containing protein [Micromonosporaceae bacterium]|jgi:hypothetical protein